MKSPTTPQLLLAPVTANQDWVHRFTANNAEELRKAIAEAHTKGPFTVQYLSPIQRIMHAYTAGNLINNLRFSKPISYPRPTLKYYGGA